MLQMKWLPGPEIMDDCKHTFKEFRDYAKQNITIMLDAMLDCMPEKSLWSV